MNFNFYQSVPLRLECSARLFVWVQTLESTPKERRFISFMWNRTGFPDLGEIVQHYVFCHVRSKLKYTSGPE